LAERGQSGLRQPTGTAATTQDPRDVGTNRRSAEIGPPQTVHTRAFAPIAINPIRRAAPHSPVPMVRPRARGSKGRRA